LADAGVELSIAHTLSCRCHIVTPSTSCDYHLAKEHQTSLCHANK
jgi:hypothetical protein